MPPLGREAAHFNLVATACKLRQTAVESGEFRTCFCRVMYSISYGKGVKPFYLLGEKCCSRMKYSNNFLFFFSLPHVATVLSEIQYHKKKKEINIFFFTIIVWLLATMTLFIFLIRKTVKANFNTGCLRCLLSCFLKIFCACKSIIIVS